MSRTMNVNNIKHKSQIGLGLSSIFSPDDEVSNQIKSYEDKMRRA